MFELLMQPVGVLGVNVNTDSIGDWAGTQNFTHSFHHHHQSVYL